MKYALPAAAFVIILLLLCNATTVGVLLYQTFRNPIDESFVEISAGLVGESGLSIDVSRGGLWADSYGGAVATVEVYVHEPEIIAPARATPTWTPTPGANSAIRIAPESAGDSDLALAIIATLIAPTATPTPTATPEPAIFTLSGASRYRLRSCPRQDCSIEGHLYPGQRSEIIGKDPTGTWFLVQDEYGRELWVAGEKAVVMGVNSQIPAIPVESQRVAGADIVYRRPTVAPVLAASVTPVPVVSTLPFALVKQDSFTSDEPQRILIWIHDDGSPVGGVAFEVRHNGRIVQPDSGWMTTSAPNAHHSWPRPYGDKRQRDYNAKLEFREEERGGEWQVTPFYQGLANGIGMRVGEPVKFTVAVGTTNELYAVYERR